jgi:hypothetical protein
MQFKASSDCERGLAGQVASASSEQTAWGAHADMDKTGNLLIRHHFVCQQRQCMRTHACSLASVLQGQSNIDARMESPRHLPALWCLQSKTQGSDIQKFQQAGIPLKMDADAAHMHHKVLPMLHAGVCACVTCCMYSPMSAVLACPKNVVHAVSATSHALPTPSHINFCFTSSQLCCPLLCLGSLLSLMGGC